MNGVVKVTPEHCATVLCHAVVPCVTVTVGPAILTLGGATVDTLATQPWLGAACYCSTALPSLTATCQEA